jgi:hypothetical protein
MACLPLGGFRAPIGTGLDFDIAKFVESRSAPAAHLVHRPDAEAQVPDFQFGT